MKAPIKIQSISQIKSKHIYIVPSESEEYKGQAESHLLMAL